MFYYSGLYSKNNVDKWCANFLVSITVPFLIKQFDN